MTTYTDDGAIKPTFSITKAEEVEQISEDEETVEDTEDSIADLAYHTGFQKIREIIESRITEYRSGKHLDINGLSLEDVGKKYIISASVANELEGILGVIDGAAEAKKQRR